jgi:hypothetical protein
MDTNATIEKRCFLHGSCWEVITRTVGAMSSFEFCTGGCEDRTSVYEAEESPLLRTVTKQRLVKADSEDLAYALVICKGCRSVIAL